MTSIVCPPDRTTGERTASKADRLESNDQKPICISKETPVQSSTCKLTDGYDRKNENPLRSSPMNEQSKGSEHLIWSPGLPRFLFRGHNNRPPNVQFPHLGSEVGADQNNPSAPGQSARAFTVASLRSPPIRTRFQHDLVLISPKLSTSLVSGISLGLATRAAPFCPLFEARPPAGLSISLSLPPYKCKAATT